MISVKYSELELAFEFVNFGMMGDHEAYFSLDTGRIYWVSSDLADELTEDEIPDDLYESDRYVAIPHRHDLDLGRDLVFRFVEQELPGRHEWIRDTFRSRGAYRRFKDMLEEEGMLDRWYRFEQEATAEALRQWCEDHGIELVHDRGDPPGA